MAGVCGAGIASCGTRKAVRGKRAATWMDVGVPVRSRVSRLRAAVGWNGDEGTASRGVQGVRILDDPVGRSCAGGVAVSALRVWGVPDVWERRGGGAVFGG